MLLDGKESRPTNGRMLIHLRELMQDACEYNCTSVTNYHADELF